MTIERSPFKMKGSYIGAAVGVALWIAMFNQQLSILLTPIYRIVLFPYIWFWMLFSQNSIDIGYTMAFLSVFYLVPVGFIVGWVFEHLLNKLRRKN